MSWHWQFARAGYYRLTVRETYYGWNYEVWWDNTDTGARTTVGKGSQKYDDVNEARAAAVSHLATLIPKAQAERLLATQTELVWEPFFDPKKRRPLKRRKRV